jgi:hypothetical protein
MASPGLFLGVDSIFNPAKIIIKIKITLLKLYVYSQRA